MILLVTGGSGFIGSNFIRALLKDDGAKLLSAGYSHVLNLDKLTYAGNPANLRDVDQSPLYSFRKGDIGDREFLAGLFRSNEIGAVVNFAAESHVDRSIDSPEPFFITNTIGTMRLLDTVRDHLKTLPENKRRGFRFLHVSTDEVYGSLSPEEPAFTEKTPVAPNSPYAASKAASDLIVKAYHHTYGLPLIITNCSNNYGPHQFPEKLIPLVILNAVEGKPLPIYGDGLNVRDWLYVGDHCDALLATLRGGTPGETYNIGGRNEQSNLFIVDRICRLLDEFKPRGDGKSHATLKTFVRDRPGHDRRYAIDCSKIEKELGWKPAVDMETGLRQTVRWYLDNRDWCDDITRGTYHRERLGSL